MSLESSPSESNPSQVTLAATDEGKKFDPDFYFDNTFVVFKVGRHLFRAPAYLFVKESPYFAHKLQLFTLESPEGVSEPVIPLATGVQRKDFRNLLKALYPLSLNTDLSLSEDEWISVLNLSIRWSFYNLREMAIGSLQSLTPFNKLTLGRRHRISSLIRTGLTEIVDQERSIDYLDATYLDFQHPGTTNKVYRLREQRLKNELDRYRGVSRSESPKPLPTDSGTIDDAFAVELALCSEIETERKRIYVKLVARNEKMSMGNTLGK